LRTWDITAAYLSAKKDELMFTIHAHPTLSEAMLDAYAAVEGEAINA
jgi:dihydrolipoamide dehydrogenase